MKNVNFLMLSVLLASSLLMLGCENKSSSTGSSDSSPEVTEAPIADEAKPLKLRIGWVFAMANAPALIAKEKGYFKEEGLDVEILSFTSGPIVHQALAAGELDMAYIGSPPVYHGIHVD